jgi:spermidine synthase
VVGVISTLVGLEIPIVTRIVKEYFGLKDALANILSFDYLGALLASVLFPLVLLPYLGIMKTSFAIGLINILVAALNLWVFRNHIDSFKRYALFTFATFALLVVGFYQSFNITSFFEKFVYQDPIVYSSQTPYQRIIITKHHDDTRLFLNGNIQFSSIDEYRYHEALVHVPMSLARSHESILVLGGGDGLAIRELLKYPNIKEIVLVDIDPEMVDIATKHPTLASLNKGALEDRRVKIVTEDAFKYLEKSTELFSVMIIDLPDPNDLPLGKLYTKEFYEIVKKRLSADGLVVTQASSPYFARKPFWCIHHTMAEVFNFVQAYTIYVPSFGQWGFQLAGNYTPGLSNAKLRVKTRFVTNSMLPRLFEFDSDTDEIPTEVNRLDNQILVDYYEKSWVQWN